MLSGRDLMMRFIEEIWSQVLKSNGLPGLSNDEILEVLAFQMSSADVTIHLTYDSHWAVGWTISPRVLHYSDFKQKILLEIHDKTWGEIVPAHILQFVHM